MRFSHTHSNVYRLRSYSTRFTQQSLRRRYCDPGTGRFIGEDPAKHGRNWFIYCGNNPINEVDATGLDGDLVSLNVSMTGEMELEGESGLSIFKGDVQVTGEIADMYVSNMESSGGYVAWRSIVAAIRAWVMSAGCSTITIGGLTTEQGKNAMKTIVMIINKMGDNGELQDDGVFTQIYWVLQDE